MTIGRVESVGLSNDGVVAHMRLNSDTPVPENVTATVKSVSAVGEQYVDLVPPADASNQMLRDNSDIGMDHTAIGQDISGLLTQADALVNSIGNSRIQDLLRETFKAFNGSGPELSRLIQSSRLLVDEANANYGQTTQLIDQVGPFLDAQIRSGDDIKSLADGLARFTSEAAKADPQLRNVLQTVPGATEAANTTFDGIRPTFPMLAANLANFGRIGVIYRKSIEQALVIFPALMAALITVGGGVPADEGGKLDFKVDLGDPPPCSTGFIPPTEIRSPADTTLRDLPTDLYCKTAQNDAAVVRGARNYPCQEFPGKRAPTVQLCRDPRGYVPIGTNPWRGPPIPYGTPMDQREDNHYEPPGRNIAPYNKFPFIPPGADYDPGPPSVQLPPGVLPGPGPAPNAPFPLPVPPNDNGPPPAVAVLRAAGSDPAAVRPVRARGAASARPRAVARRGACARCSGSRRARSRCPATARRRCAAAGQRSGDHHVRFKDRCVRRPRRGDGRVRRRYGQGCGPGDVGRPDDGSTISVTREKNG